MADFDNNFVVSLIEIIEENFNRTLKVPNTSIPNKQVFISCAWLFSEGQSSGSFAMSDRRPESICDTRRR